MSEGESTKTAQETAPPVKLTSSRKTGSKSQLQVEEIPNETTETTIQNNSTILEDVEPKRKLSSTKKKRSTEDLGVMDDKDARYKRMEEKARIYRKATRDHRRAIKELQVIIQQLQNEVQELKAVVSNNNSVQK